MLTISIFLTACNDQQRRVDRAGQTIGQAAARETISLPKMPSECYQGVPHADRALDQEVLGILRREIAQLDLSNDSKARCVGFYTALARRLAL